MKDKLQELIKRTLDRYPHALWSEGVSFSAVSLTRGQELKDEYFNINKRLIPENIRKEKLANLERLIKTHFETVQDPAFSTNFFIKWE